ncbi:SusD/RagB family nutrient-binding outer membrane lipoprotein [Parabacteroides sp. AF17-3]|uniref:SusD/RagB family nutrient-binding outer membrane lipoprotein n=1 Tax=Parabacteroides sp. AF17-3 TaxID=2293113 RepID=UPI000EFDC3D7|nr:SusD/RagB family nutrient-binding outer membrane lipoprotein [Parabacteroides sp. AF17-3]RKU73596.1 SusD/RagB family nutrient-binding outer membrane lipoprotein [Parabacteroides sp. AF17-3]
MKALKYIFLSALFIAGYGCSAYDDINTNPNAATTVSSSLLATPLLLDLTATGGTASGFISDNCLAKQMVWLESLHDYNYNVLGRAGLGGYKTLMNAVKMVELAPEEDKAAYQGLGLFIKTYKLFYTSMQLGDIPYSEALQGEEGNVKPKYDPQEDVMIAIMNDLDESARFFSEAHDFEGDPILQGNISKWQKTVDAFRLKVLLYLSMKEDHPVLKIKERFARIVTEGKLMKSNEDNFQLVFSNKAGQTYPFNTSVSKHYMYSTISSVMVDTLKAYNDYRLFYFAEPAKALISQGLQANDMNAYAGLDPAGDFSDLQSMNADGKCCTMNLRYTEVVSGEPYIRLGYAEQCFILAEGVLRGWISGDANTYYNNGIKAAMKFVADNTPDDNKYHHGMKITEAYITDYLNSDRIILSGSFDHKLKQIIGQKYLAYYMQHPFDAYYEYRRTGYPELPINPETNRNTVKDKIPVRWMYSTWEYDFNRESVEEAVARQYGGLDDNNKLMWILQK